MPVLHGKYFTPDGSYINDFLNPQNVVLTSTSPGGWASATWASQVGPPYLGLAEARQNSKVEIYDNSAGLVFRGRMEDPGYQIRAPRGTLQLLAHGYGVSMGDRPYEGDRSFLAGETTDSVMRAVRDDLCPDIDSRNRLIIPTTRQLNAATGSFIDQRAGDIFRQISQVGDENDNPLLWHVWEGRPGSTEKAELEIIPRPTTPSYYVAVGDGASLDLSAPLSDMYNRVVVRYLNGTQRIPVDDIGSQAQPPGGYGVTRTLLFDAPQITSVVDATNMGRSLLTRTSRVRVRGRALTIPSSCPIEDAAGGIVPPYLVRSGRMIEVSDLRAAALSTTQYRYVIASCQYADSDGSLSITPEQLDPMTSVLARLARTNPIAA